MLVEIWVKIPLGRKSDPLKKPYVLVGATTRDILLFLWF